MHDSNTTTAVNVANCDREPIHILGTIQSHGGMVVCTGPEWRIAHASANAARMFATAPDRLLGQPLIAIVGPAAAHRLMSAVDTSQEVSKARLFRFEVSGGNMCHANVISQGGRVLVEVEPIDAADEVNTPLELVGALLSRLQQAQSIDRLCAFAAERVRTLIRYDRVMVYKFLYDGTGEVVAESKRPELTPFLNLRYPASDIPQQARALYLKSWIRLIADVTSAPVPIEPPRDASGQPVDLTYSCLRSVSPIHIEYLSNMGVAASMSISIIVGGKLWGLIACHNSTPKVVSADVRGAAELFGQIFSLQIEALEPNDRAQIVRTARGKIDALVASFPSSGSLLDNMSPLLGDLRTLIACDGAGLWIDGVWVATGSTPPPRDIPALARFVASVAGPDEFATHELSNRLPAASGYATVASGVMAVPLSRAPRDFIFFFRREQKQTITWGGNPNKAVTLGPNGARLTPRASFAAWEEEVRGQSLPWQDVDQLTANALKISLLEVVLRLSEIAARERADANQRQMLLIAELNHRVKNVLALISALVARGQKDGETLKSYVEGLQGRIKALSFAHDQASGDGAGAINQLIEAEVAPYRTGKGQKIDVGGPSVLIDSHAFSVLALVMHEMATNAAKYGALSDAAARLTIGWHMNAAGDCVIDWRESGGPAVQVPNGKASAAR